MKFCCSLGNANPEYLIELAQTAEANGWDTVSLNEHMLHPEVFTTPYPYSADGQPPWQRETPWPDVWVATAMMAAATKTLRFTQGIYVLAMRDPFSVAKALSTCAYMSGNRVSLGIGMGWMQQEFEILGQDFANRGPRTDEMVEIIRKLCTGEVVSHQGKYYQFDALSMSPGVAEKIPVIIGGMSKKAIERVAKVGDGWAPAYLTVAEVAGKMAEIRQLRKEMDVANQQLEIYAACSDANDLDGYRRMDEAGISHLVIKPWTRYTDKVNKQGIGSLADMKDGLKRFADEIISNF